MTVRHLIKIDLETLEMTIVGDVNEGGANKFFQYAFFGNDGKLYGIEYNNRKLWEVDTETAHCTEVCTLTFPEVGNTINMLGNAAAVDPVTGDVYIATGEANMNLYKLKLDGAESTVELIGALPGNEHLWGMYIPYTEADAPAATTQNRYEDGKVKFIAPTTTYTSGATLTGALTAHVTIDGNAQTVTVNPGDETAIETTLAAGPHKVKVFVEQGGKKGPERAYNIFVGNYLPLAVENVEYTVDNNVATLTWTAPTKAANNGPVDDASINYTIVRQPDNVIVAENIKETSFTETLPASRRHYYYEITANTDNLPGETFTTGTHPGGTEYDLPFEEGFLTQEDFDTFKVVDGNGDSKSWWYVAISQNVALQGNGVTSAESGYVATNNDDYLISLPINLKAGVDYRVTVNFGEPYVYESIRLLLSPSRTHNDPATQEIAAFTVKWGNPEDRQVESHVFNVAADGQYSFIIHSNTVGNSVDLSVNSFAMEIESVWTGPAAVTDIAAKAGDMGALNNTISFTAPTKTYKDEQLGDLTRIEILRDGRLVHTIDNPAKGEAITWTDNDVQGGLHTYSVIPFNAAGQGLTAKVTNWVGLDIPAVPRNIKARMTDDIKPVFTWDATTEGAHGGYVDASNIRYTLVKYNEYNWDNHWEPAVDGLTETGTTHTDYFNYGSPEYPYQEYLTYAVRAYNEAGVSDLGMVEITIGHPYPMPFKETFDFYGMVGTESSPWTLHATSYYYAWNMVNGDGLAVKPYDKDAGMLSFTLLDDDSNNQFIESPRVSVKDATMPVLNFYMYHGNEADKGDLKLIVYTNVDDEGFEQVAEVDYNTSIRGWTRHSVKLPTDADNVILGFGAYAYDASAQIYVDNIRVEEGVANEVAIDGITADKRVNKGENGTVNVTVYNLGQEPTGAFTVTLYRDEAVFATVEVADLEPNGVKSLTFDVPTEITDGGSSFAFSAEVTYDKDADETNNKSAEVTMYVTGSIYPAVETLAGIVADNGTVTLTWDAPSSEYVEDITDTFEDYESFIIDGIGDWTTYDGDGSTPVYFGGPSVPNNYEPQAWQVWAPEEAGFALDNFPVLTPKSGSKVLANWAASDGVSSVLEQDDWLISCEALGGSDLSFWACVPNEGSAAQKIEILYSTTDAEPENFLVLDSEAIEGSTDWFRFVYTLPLDAKYFAIRSCGDGYVTRTVLFLDDINYTPLFGAKGNLELTAYNIYRDGKLIGSSETNSFDDADHGFTEHTYYVTAVWDKGESLASPAWSSDYSGIDAVSAPQARIAVNSTAILVSNIAGRDLAVYTVDGKTVFTCTGRDSAAVNVPKGVYIVVVDNNAVKVSVM